MTSVEEHYHQAERLLTEAGEPGAAIGDPMKTIARELVRANRIAIAQVHATLASALEVG